MFEYWIIEMQSAADGTGGCFSWGFHDKGEAEGKYLATRESARQSNIAVHTVLFLTSRGDRVERPAVYIHPQETPQTPQTPEE